MTTPPLHSTDQLSVESVSDLNSLQAEWRQLQSSIDDCHFFLTWEWFDAALKWQEQVLQPFFLLVREQKNLIGIAACNEKHVKRNKISRRVIELIQIPDSQLCNIVCTAENYAKVALAIAEHFSRAKDWHELQLSRLPDGPQNKLRHAVQATGLSCEVIGESGNPYINLKCTWTEFYATRSRRLKKGNNLIANKLKKAHQNIEIEWLQQDTVDTSKWQTALSTAKSISAKCWKKETGLTLDNAGPQNFIDKLSEHAIQNQQLSIWLLYLDKVAVAMEYQIICNGQVHALRADYDNDYAELSPGSYLNWKLLEQLFDADLQQYQMGPGDNPYKQRWAEGELPLYTVRAYNKNLKGRLLNILELKLKPAVKAIIKLFKRS